MDRRWWIPLVVTAAVAGGLCAGSALTARADGSGRPAAAVSTVAIHRGAAAGGWVGSWAAAPVSGDAVAAGVTVRNVLTLSVGGDAVRVRLTNALGDTPLPLSHATLARAVGAGPAAQPGSLRVLTFGGRSTTTVPAHADVLSDPARLPVAARTRLLVTAYVAHPTGPATRHDDAQQTTFYTTAGDHSADVGGAAYTHQLGSFYYVDGIDVHASTTAGAVVAFGDSITDGYQSTVGADHRWPDYLARRTGRLGVLNAGISGNRVLLDGSGPNALARLDRDALSHPGMRTIVLLEGINDIDNDPPQPDAGAIEAGLAQLASQAHAAGLRVVGGTLTPDEGALPWTAAREVERQAVNRWIRRSPSFDAVVDFAGALADPGHPTRLRPAFDSGDHLHPNDAGYRAMAAAVPLAVLY